MTGLVLVNNGVSKKKKKENFQFRISEDELKLWKKIVEEDPGIKSVSQLIRNSVRDSLSPSNFLDFKISCNNDDFFKASLMFKELERKLNLGNGNSNPRINRLKNIVILFYLELLHL